jgi:hypothetical protein
MKRKKNGSRIKLREKPLRQESEVKIDRHQFRKFRKIRRMLKARD